MKKHEKICIFEGILAPITKKTLYGRIRKIYKFQNSEYAVLFLDSKVPSGFVLRWNFYFLILGQILGQIQSMKFSMQNCQRKVQSDLLTVKFVEQNQNPRRKFGFEVLFKEFHPGKGLTIPFLPPEYDKTILRPRKLFLGS
jgi:hypothetical protein